MLNFAQPFLDDQTLQAVSDVLRSLWITSGPKTLEFESALSKTLGGRPVRVVSSATAAMEIALELCGIGPGDEVITSAQSFFSTMNTIVRVGAKPIFVDCDLRNRAINLTQVSNAISPRTKAIMPTHFPGSLVDMNELFAIAKRHKLRVIEDAALVQGSLWQKQPIGSFGDITTFSFHPNKNITTIEGGAISVSTEIEAAKIETLRFHGISRLPDGTRDVLLAGGKFNLSDVSSVIGLHQLTRLSEFLAKRQILVQRYFGCLSSIPDVILPANEMEGQSWNMFCVLFPFDESKISRKTFRDRLLQRGISTGVSYEALHTTTLGRTMGYKIGDYPNAERIANETVTLPLHVTMTLEDVDRVCSCVREIWG